jgi:hypothetical protein
VERKLANEVAGDTIMPARYTIRQSWDWTHEQVIRMVDNMLVATIFPAKRLDRWEVRSRDGKRLGWIGSTDELPTLLRKRGY